MSAPDRVEGRQWSGDLTISPDVDGHKCHSLYTAIVACVDKWLADNGEERLAPLIHEALLAATGDLIQGAPLPDIRAELAVHSIDFVMRNCGVPARLVWASFVASRGVSMMKPAGSA